MFRLLYLLCIISVVTSRIFYLDRYTFENNPALMNATIAYAHNNEGAVFSNITVQTFKTITKLLAYVRGCILENKDDRDFKKETLRTVIDLEKIAKGIQQNPFLRNFIKELMKNLDYELKVPMKAVR